MLFYNPYLHKTQQHFLSLDVTHGELQILPSIINDLTATNKFASLTLQNHQGIMDRHLQRQRQNLPTKSPKVRETAPSNIEDIIDVDSNMILGVGPDSGNIHALFENTRQVFGYFSSSILIFLVQADARGLKNYSKILSWKEEW